MESGYPASGAVNTRRCPCPECGEGLQEYQLVCKKHWLQLTKEERLALGALRSDLLRKQINASGFAVVLSRWIERIQKRLQQAAGGKDAS